MLNYHFFHQGIINRWISPSGAGIGIIWAKYVSTMAADALAPYITRSSVAVVLTACNVDINILPDGEYQQLAMFQSWWMIQDANIFYVSRKK